MKDIKFNYGSKYDKGGQQMEVVTLDSIDIRTISKIKSKQPWCQVFSTGYRVTNDNIDWSKWNGCVYSDIDSKNYYTNVKEFDVTELRECLYLYLLTHHNENFYWLQTSHSGNSYHVLFYFDVDKTEINFKKCAQIVKSWIYEAFVAIGCRDIITYPKVMDKCSQSPLQGMYVTHHEMLFGHTKTNWFGLFEDIDDYELEDIYAHKQSDVKDDGTKLFELKSYNPTTGYIRYFDHHERRHIYAALRAVYNTREEVDREWLRIVEQITPGHGHTLQFYQREHITNNWYDYYGRRKDFKVNVNVLIPFGYSFTKIFEPTKIEDYEPDVVYNLAANEYLSDLKITWSREKINHLYAGCSLGKTFFAKNLGANDDEVDDIDWLLFDEMRGKRVCFIAPMKSIIKDAFGLSKRDDWMPIDGDHKDENKERYDSTYDKLWRSSINVCTTWESYCAYEMYKINFDYVIVDEVHTFFMYDYRVESITNMKRALNAAKGIRIIMTGTPSAEIREFDCYKIKINKELPKVPTEIVLFKNDFRGHWLSDIREWTADKSHYAIIFQDRTNYKIEELFERAGMKCEVFNTSYTDNVNYILNKHNVFSQITAFSVYGQAGINLYIDTDKKIRIYVLNKNGLGIIQYANRVRNKEVIDKVMIGYPCSEVSNDVVSLKYDIDYDEAERIVEIINKNRVVFDIFDVRTKELIKLSYGIPFDCLDVVGERVTLNRDKYKTWKMIKNVAEYERQLQVIYNRLVDNDFEVKITRLMKDTKDIADTKLLSHRFAGQMTRFDFDMFIEKEDGGYWLKPNEAFKKICTGDLVKTIENVFNILYVENNGDFEKTKQSFKHFVNTIIQENGTIKKKDISNYELMLRISKDWDKYYDNAFVTILLREDVNVAQIAALYVRSKWVDGMDWKSVSEEAYDKINSLKKVVDAYKDVFANLDKPNEYNITVDVLTEQIYGYLVGVHTRGNKANKKIVYKGVEYDNIDDAVEKTGKTKQAIYKWMRTNA